MKALPTVQQLNDRFTYNPESGELIWKNGRCKGKAAGFNQNGYRLIRLSGVTYYAHRLIWKMVKGADPAFTIDHINGDGSDNRIDNLRDVEHKVNLKNQKLRSTNTTGITGVYWREDRGVWSVSAHVGGKLTVVGAFKCLLSAVAARKSVERNNGYHKNHGRVAV